MPSEGIIILNKPQGMSSHDAVSFVRRLLGVKRVGHSGTLDPMATGVLPIFVGKATRLIEFATEDENKSYRCDMRLGFESDTQDVWGDVTATNASLPSERDIRRVLLSFVGASTQRTPLYSAVKYKGRKLYEYARAGEQPPEEALKEREITIDSLVIHEIDAALGEVSFTLCCSRGTYVRTICSDAGKLLGCGAVMSRLTRLHSGVFTIAESHTPEVLTALAETGAPLPLLPMDACIAGMPKTSLTAADGARFMNGLRVSDTNGAGDALSLRTRSAIHGNATNSFVRVYAEENATKRFIGIARREGNTLKPYKVIVSEYAQSRESADADA